MNLHQNLAGNDRAKGGLRNSVFWCVDFQSEALFCIPTAAQTSLSPLTLDNHPDRLTQPRSLSLSYSMNMFVWSLIIKNTLYMLTWV